MISNQNPANTTVVRRVKTNTGNFFLQIFRHVQIPNKTTSQWSKTIPLAYLFFPLLLTVITTQAQIKYEGTIGDYKITLRLEYPIEQATEPAYFNTHTEIIGSYWYNHNKKPIPLRGLWDNSGALFLVDENKNGSILLTFEHFNPQKKHLDGHWKGEKTEPVVLRQTENVIPEKAPPLRYIGWLHGETVTLNLEQPLKQVKRIEGQNIAFHPFINKTKGTFSFTKRKQTIPIVGTWSEKGLMLKGMVQNNEVLFYLRFEPFEIAVSKLIGHWVGDPEKQIITFFKTLDATIETTQDESTAQHRFKVIRYKKKDLERNAVAIYNKATGQLIQRLEDLDCNESSATRSDTMEVGDYNFDGFPDVKFFCDRHLKSASCKLLLYDPKNNAYHLTKSIDANAVFDSKKKVFTEITYTHNTKIERTYRWEDYVFFLDREKTYRKKNKRWVKMSFKKMNQP